MKYLNLTPHAITLRLPSGDITIPPDGTVARVEMREQHWGWVGGEQFPVITRAAQGVVGLPTHEDRVGEELICLVSSMVLDALTPFNAVNVYAPDTGPTAIRNDKGHVVAVTRLVAR
jgi:hypothetical protein